MRNNLKITLFFFIAAIAGTLLHECGHAIVSMYYSFHPEISYAYSTWYGAVDKEAIAQGAKLFDDDIKAVITLGGPIQTISTGFIGLIALLILNRRTQIDAWNTKHLFWIVLSFFHSREVFNSVGILYNVYAHNKASRSDEFRLLWHWDMPVTTYIWVLLIVSSALLAYIVFVLVKKHRWQLIVFGGVGSFLGAWFWLYSYGEKILP